MDYIAEIAAALHLSKTTVFKALSRNRYVSYETQKLVRDYVAERYPELQNRRDLKSQVQKNITIAMPYKPSFFWNIAIQGINDAIREESDYSDRIALKFVFYTGNYDEEEQLSILNELSLDLPDALLVVPINAPRIVELLSGIAEKIPVVFLNDYCENCEGIISVIPNGFEEGREIGRMMAASMRKNGHGLVLRNTDSSMVRDERLCGVYESIKEKGITLKTCDIAPLLPGPDNENRNLYNSIYPSLIARTISHQLDENTEIEAVYVTDGILGPLMQAINKLRRKDIKIFGHETNRVVQSFFDAGLKGGYVSQDIYNEARTAVRILLDIVLGNIAYQPEMLRFKYDTYQFR